MRFSIVTPSYNNLPELQGCLASLEKLEGPEFEVLVGVDGSTDGTQEWLRQAQFSYPLHVLVHPEGENRGRSATRNLALGQLSGDFVLFLDSDMEVAPDLLQQHEAVLREEGTVSIGSVRYRNRRANLWVRYTSERGVAKYQHREEVPFNYFITPNTAVPARFFSETGGFDPQIRHYGGEDMELGYRIQRKFQPRFVYNAEARVYTTQLKTLDQALHQLREYGATGLRYIADKWPALRQIYWVDRVRSRKLKDRLLAILIHPVFRPLARFGLWLLPYSLKKNLINYLVISYVHEGYRSGRY